MTRKRGELDDIADAEAAASRASPKPAKPVKEARLAAALRANLRRRKASAAPHDNSPGAPPDNPPGEEPAG